MRLKKLLFRFFLVFSFLFPAAAHADDRWASYKRDLKRDFESISLSKEWDLFLPVNTWHNRAMYDKKKTDTYNEKPWGFGFGKHVYEDDVYKGLYVMAFKDSHNKIEPIFGYIRQWNHYFGIDRDFSAGAGYTFGFTFRDDYDYMPIPVILPVFSLQYKKVALQTTYIPGPYNMFNVLFTWLRIEL